MHCSTYVATVESAVRTAAGARRGRVQLAATGRGSHLGRSVQRRFGRRVDRIVQRARRRVEVTAAHGAVVLALLWLLVVVVMVLRRFRRRRLAEQLLWVGVLHLLMAFRQGVYAGLHGFEAVEVRK